jgi:hypothetical protein
MNTSKPFQKNNSRIFTRRKLIKTLAVSTAAVATPSIQDLLAIPAKSDSMPMQIYKSLSDEQKEKICLPIDDSKRQKVSNFWFIHPDHHIPDTFNGEQQELIQAIFDSLHSEEYQEQVKTQVKLDTWGSPKAAPSVGFFGSPDDADFEFIYTGHHVIRRCNAHSDKGLGFGGNPIFYGYGHIPLMKNEVETADHPGNPYWYQGLIFNEFVNSLNDVQRKAGLVQGNPRSEKDEVVIKKSEQSPGLKTSELSADQKDNLWNTMRRMMAIFRKDDVDATMKTMRDKQIIERLSISWYAGKYDVGSDKVWDTWQIEGLDMVWYFVGYPHIHCYFHLKS